ncbi:ATP-grasp domain-containing protein [Actinospica durhamensis]|uniref:ATP-grasp domain-containing protein n=1 Tax=Actinospica durhamensis TaxID=1508375 RepID=A0A941EMR1_9ACTN|nr:ATP-grasp domain-containing protein [Actinospica durhamensis]MBR7834136.1 ATP-grasp domain-containing protein [Actinospica durhamensis]
MASLPVLVFPPRFNDTARVLSEAAARRGLRIETLSTWRVPEHLRGHGAAHLYAGPLFADAVGAELNLALLQPPEDFLPSLDPAFLARDVRLASIAEARTIRRPVFVKPPADKQFPAKVYADGSKLPGPDAVDDDLPVLVSDVVRFLVEYRLFVLDGAIHTGSRYATDGDLDIAPLDPANADTALALDFADDLLRATAARLPSAVVVDVGILRSEDGARRPAVIEANMAWASGHYAADADRVLDVVLRAAFDHGMLTTRDTPFARPVPAVRG